MKDFCESCGENKAVRWVCVDDDMECTMCARCRAIMKANGMKIELIKQ